MQIYFLMRNSIFYYSHFARILTQKNYKNAIYFLDGLDERIPLK